SRTRGAEGERQSQILQAEGHAQAIGTVFQAVHRNDADAKVLAYQYLQTLPQLAQAEGNTFWVIPSEVTSALRTLSGAFGGEGAGQPAGPSQPGGPSQPAGRGHPGQVTGATTAALTGGTGLPGADGDQAGTGDPAEGPALIEDAVVAGDPANGDLTRAEQVVAEQAARTREELA